MRHPKRMGRQEYVFTWFGWVVGDSHGERRTYREVLTMVRMPAYFRRSKSHIIVVLSVSMSTTWERISSLLFVGRGRSSDGATSCTLIGGVLRWLHPNLHAQFKVVFLKSAHKHGFSPRPR
jgi:hypothetical protein